MKFEELKVGDIILYKSQGYVLQQVLEKKGRTYDFKVLANSGIAWNSLKKEEIYNFTFISDKTIKINNNYNLKIIEILYG